uniref:Ig-like domain-containing protein n=1 Tax=Pundamilia nyererei TaxID=303518 RepID=A0A3B4FPF2_9CICH
YFIFIYFIFYANAVVSCDLKENCILPCQFPPGPEEVIHWMTENIAVHSFYYNKDQLGSQNQRRASLFKDQISNGNASLQLTSVEFQDEGRYKCATGGNNDSFISLKQSLSYKQKTFQDKIIFLEITCSSEGIYPEPLLTWSTSRQTVFRSTTIVQQSGPNRELYNIKSSVIFPDTKHDFTDMTYSCTVSTRSNNKTAILSNRNLKEGKCVLRFCFVKTFTNIKCLRPDYDLLFYYLLKTYLLFLLLTFLGTVTWCLLLMHLLDVDTFI